MCIYIQIHVLCFRRGMYLFQVHRCGLWFINDIQAFHFNIFSQPLTCSFASYHLHISINSQVVVGVPYLICMCLKENSNASTSIYFIHTRFSYVDYYSMHPLHQIVTHYVYCHKDLILRCTYSCFMPSWYCTDKPYSNENSSFKCLSRWIYSCCLYVIMVLH